MQNLQNNIEFTPCQTDFSPANLEQLESSSWAQLTEMARQSEAFNRYDMTESLWITALRIASAFKVDDSRGLYNVSSLASFYFRNGNIPNARKWFLAEAHLAHKIFGSNHERSANALSRLGTFYILDGSYPAAIRCFKKAIEIHTRNSGADSGMVKDATNSLALVTQMAGY